MDIIKQIINCETNTKFVKVYNSGDIEIPDVIFSVLYESGDMDVVGRSLHEEYPQIAGEVEDEYDSVLLGVLKGDHIDAFFNYLEYECDDAFVTVKSFVKEAKRILPYLRIDKSVDEWIKEH